MQLGNRAKFRSALRDNVLRDRAAGEESYRQGPGSAALRKVRRWEVGFIGLLSPFFWDWVGLSSALSTHYQAPHS